MKVLVTGSNGLCGNSIKSLSSSSNHDFTFIGRNSIDLRNQNQVDDLFNSINDIDAVIHTAARVGGIGANLSYPESFFYDNIMINTNIIHNCIKKNIKKLFAFSSVCVFPDNLTLLEEEKINDGPVYGANFAYGYSKRMVDVHINAAKKQYNIKNWCSIIPGNIYGPYDMFSIKNGHIIPALIHKMYLSKINNKPLEMWGDGLSLREFIFVDDLASMLIQLLDKEDIPDKIIMSGIEETSIKNIVDILSDIADFKNDVIWDTSKPNGQRSRPSSKARVNRLFPDFKYTDLRYGLEKTWNWFCNNYPNVRTEYNA
jgi:GDP-L-fucose synthase